MRSACWWCAAAARICGRRGGVRRAARHAARGTHVSQRKVRNAQVGVRHKLALPVRHAQVPRVVVRRLLQQLPLPLPRLHARQHQRAGRARGGHGRGCGGRGYDGGEGAHAPGRPQQIQVHADAVVGQRLQHLVARLQRQLQEAHVRVHGALVLAHVVAQHADHEIGGALQLVAASAAARARLQCRGHRCVSDSRRGPMQGGASAPIAGCPGCGFGTFGAAWCASAAPPPVRRRAVRPAPRPAHAWQLHRPGAAPLSSSCGMLRAKRWTARSLHPRWRWACAAVRSAARPAASGSAGQCMGGWGG